MNEDDEYPVKGLIIGTKIVFGEPKKKNENIANILSIIWVYLSGQKSKLYI